MPTLFPNSVRRDARVMLFADGENLAIRYGKMLSKKGGIPFKHVRYRPDVYVWSPKLNSCMNVTVIRKHYYTALRGDEALRDTVEQERKDAGIEAPRVFKKTKERGSKRVDVSLTTDMLAHAARRNYDVAVLVAGDEDYVPLVEAVKAEGCRVVLWFVSDGLSNALKMSADYCNDIGKTVLFSESVQ